MCSPQFPRVRWSQDRRGPASALRQRVCNARAAFAEYVTSVGNLVRQLMLRFAGDAGLLAKNPRQRVEAIRTPGESYLDAAVRLTEGTRVP